MKKKQIMMSFAFFDMVAAGALCGYMCHKHNIGGGWEILMGAILCMVAMFVGMILALMVSDDRERGKRIKVERNFQIQLNQIAINERLNCARVSVNIATLMTDRVANKIVAKYVDGMSDDGKRKSVIEGVNKIVKEETDCMAKILFDGLEKEKSDQEKNLK